MPMRLFICSLFLVITSGIVHGQETNTNWKANSGIFVPELLLGKTFESNDGFPSTGLQTQLIVSLGRKNENNPQEWAYRLKRPTTGLSLGVTHFGNLDSLGVAITLMPYIEFNLFKLEKLTALFGMGASYFNKEFDPVTNPNNQAVTTDFTWAFRAFFNYQFMQTKHMEWRAGIGYSHHSNGHTRLLNQGFNSVLGGVSVVFNNPEYNIVSPELNNESFTKSTFNYLSLRYGYGINVLALAFNNKKAVHTLTAEYGRIFNRTLKLGVGFSYRIYNHYYDYIKGNESLVQDGREFDYFKADPWRYAANFAITLNGEFLLNHLGLDFQLAYNIHKPGYQIDWRLNEGWDNTPREVPESWMLGEFNSKYKLKKQIATRLGLKYYLIGNNESPTHNIFLGAHINSNLGQADFTDFSIGYIYQWEREQKSK